MTTEASTGSSASCLATFVTSGGETHRFYRFRSSNGDVDYYDTREARRASSSTRRPVRGENVRITSGFGMRRHPLLMTAKCTTASTGDGRRYADHGGRRRRHRGGGRKGEYGNYIRIRHANGYKTAYGHMSRYATGVSAGVGCGRARSSATSAPQACPPDRTATSRFW